jgi:hypothetical protein
MVAYGNLRTRKKRKKLKRPRPIVMSTEEKKRVLKEWQGVARKNGKEWLESVAASAYAPYPVDCPRSVGGEGKGR